MSYGGEDTDGIYHSIYDDYYWFTHFSDTNFIYGRALSQTAGTVVLRAADAEILPFEFTNFAETVQGFIKDLQKLAKSRQEDIGERNKQIEEGVFPAINDPRRPQVAPRMEEVPPEFSWAPLENAANALTKAADRYGKALSAAKPGGANQEAARAVNQLLMQSERKLMTPDGIPRREWYKHLLYAPGFYTGYAVKTMPGVREAIEQKNYKDVDGEILRVARVLQAETELVEKAAAELERMK